MGTRSARGHRTHVSGEPRTRREVWLSSEERTVINAAAAQAGLRPGAYIAREAVRAARADTSGRGESSAAEVAPAAGVTVSGAREVLDEVRHLRRLMGNVAGNLNDVARHANSTGELVEQSDAILDFVRRTNERVDAELMAILRRLR